MTAAVNTGRPISSEPLRSQIIRADQQLQDRRRRVGVDARKLRRSVNKKLTSPFALLLAGGVGFVAGKVARRRSVAAQQADDSRAFGFRFFAGVLSIVPLVRSLLSRVRPPEDPTVGDQQNRRER